MKKILIIAIMLTFMLSGLAFAEQYEINAVYNQTLQTPYIINDTNLPIFKDNLKDTHIVSVGYYSIQTGYKDFTSEEVITLGDNIFYISMKAFNYIDTKIIELGERKPDLEYTVYNYYYSLQTTFKLKETENWYYEKPYKKVNVIREVIINE